MSKMIKFAIGQEIFASFYKGTTLIKLHFVNVIVVYPLGLLVKCNKGSKFRRIGIGDLT